MTEADLDRLRGRLGDRPHWVGFLVPGRIEVLGKHTDYAGGRSLLCTVDRGFSVVAAPRTDGVVRLVDAASEEVVELHAVAPDPRRAPRGTPRTPDWRIYPETVVCRVLLDFDVELGGCDVVFESDLPAAAGLSSSSALVTAVFLALGGVEGLRDTEAGGVVFRDRETLAAYLAAVERGSAFSGLPGAGSGRRPDAADAADGVNGVNGVDGVGLRGGGEDHTAILCSVPDALVRYRFEPIRREGVVPLPEDLVFAVASSGVRAEKTGAAQTKYNRLSDQAARAAELWRRETGDDASHLGAVLAPEASGVRLDDLERVIERARGGAEREALLRRVRHFAVESEEIIPAAAEALEREDLEDFGELVDRSHRGAERLLRNQVPETVSLQRSARERGALAASAFGAGFGGAVWALVEEETADAFLDAWREDYLEAFPERSGEARFFLTRAGRPVHAHSSLPGPLLTP